MTADHDPTTTPAPTPPAHAPGTVRHYLLVRHRHNWMLLLRFGVVGASGVVVNLAAYALLRTTGYWNDVLVDLPATDFNVRRYHLFATLAFIVANLWNFQLNRSWTFGSSGRAPWLKEYVPFLAVGVGGLVAGLVIITLLVAERSPVRLSPEVFDGSGPLRNPDLWGQFIALALVTPLSFAGNKIWTFRAVRHDPGGRGRSSRPR